MLAVMCMQQLPTMWDLQCIVGRIQPIRLCKPHEMRVHGPNNVGRALNIVALHFSDHGTKEM